MNNLHINNFGGNYGFYDHDDAKAKKEEKEVKEEVIVNKLETVEPEKVLDALNLLGAQNMAKVSKTQINPADFLSEERIASIEESMKLFEQGVEKYAGAVKEEFGNAFSDNVVYALAAEAFSREA